MFDSGQALVARVSGRRFNLRRRGVSLSLLCYRRQMIWTVPSGNTW